MSYGFKDSGDKQLGVGGDGGVWAPSMKATEAARRAAQQKTAAAEALAAMEAKIAEIRNDPALSPQAKLRALRMLTASGYSNEEHRVLSAAQEEG